MNRYEPGTDSLSAFELIESARALMAETRRLLRSADLRMDRKKNPFVVDRLAMAEALRPVVPFYSRPSIEKDHIR